MDLSIRYENSQGEVMEFGGVEDDLHYFENTLHDASAWSYDKGNGHIVEFYREAEEIPFRIGIFAKSEEEGLARREELIRLAETDIAALSMGKLYIGEWYLNCYIIARENSYWWYDGRICEIECTLLVEERTWFCDVTTHYSKTAGTTSGYNFLDFSYDHAYDYSSGKTKYITCDNASFSEADVVIRMYGAVTNPQITIANNTYGVTASVEQGGYVEIDTAAKTVKLFNPFGEWTNIFSKRLPGGEASTQYIFAKVPAGQSKITSDGTFEFDIDIKEHRSEPKWV